MAWKYYSPNLTSSQYLDQVIHKKIQDLFNRTQNQDISKKQSQAQQLEKYLLALKNYENGIVDTNIFSVIEYSQLMNVLSNIFNKNNQTAAEKIFNRKGGLSFESSMQNLASALAQICSTGDFKITPQDFSFGQAKTVVDVQKFMSVPMQEILNQMGVKTKKYLNEAAKKTRNKNQLITYLPAIDIKIDQMSATHINISTQAKNDFPNLSRFAQLFLNSSFSFKNYSYRKKSVQLGRTNSFRIISDYLSTLDLPEFDNGGEESFMIAIFNRYHKIKSSKERMSFDADAKIEFHFQHIRNIYELTGAGQNFIKDVSTDPDVKELQTFLNKGVDFLIWNEYNGKNIYVRSTAGILADYFEKGSGFSGHSRTYLSKFKNLTT